MRLKLLTAALVAFGPMAAAAAQTVAQDPVADLTQARAVFERACGVCHALERPLSKTFDRAGWERTVERMHDNGAEVDAKERAMVVAYLLCYGKEGAAHPLMDHLPATPSSTQEIIPNKWRLDFGMPSAEMVGAQESLPARGGRAGISLKLDF